MSNDTLAKRAKLITSYLISTLVPMKPHLTEWLKVPKSRYHCS